MPANVVKVQKVLFVSIFVSMSVFIIGKTSFAKIPEPDNIIYGLAGQGVDIITLKIDGQLIASYTIGSNSDAGNNYILRVPLDTLDPQEPGTARPDDVAEIYVDGVLASLEPVIIGQRGSIQEIHLATEDSDGDGLSDTEELQLGTNPYNPDTDGDGLSDYYEADNGTNPLLYDSDGDGYSDGYEVSADTNPIDENEMPVIYVDVGNSGYEDGTKDNPYNTVNEGINAAPDKYTVLVAVGIYEEGVTIDKDIRLIGESTTTTIIDAGAATDAIYYAYAAGELSCVEGFTIRNADNGINCDNGAAPLIRNNIITQIATAGIICGDSSTARIINNTISDNTDATAIQCSSSDITIVNNIISSNHIGIDCNDGADLCIDYNNVWDNSGGDYIDCIAGIHDISDDPSFVDIANGDFHLANDSPCIDAGDPVETLTEDYAGGYAGGSSLTVDEVTSIAIGDRIWITDGGNFETDIITVLISAIEIQGEFMNDYMVADQSYVFTEYSDFQYESEANGDRINIGAYGNTSEATPAQGDCYGDLDCDDDGLSGTEELSLGTDPFDADTDDDGIQDGVEDANHNGIVDAAETDPCNIDTDGDGIQDGTEKGITEPVADPDGGGVFRGTDTDIFLPDLDPGSTTDPLDNDTDNDGLLDGQEDANLNGVVDAGESDPSKRDTDGDGYTDLQEHLNWLAGELDPEGNQYDPQVNNAPGGTGYSNPDAKGFLPAILLLLGDG